MPSELQLAIKHICQEKNISEESVIAAVEAALASAYNRDYGDKKTQNVKVSFHPEDMGMEVYDVKEVVDDSLALEPEAPSTEENQKPKYNPKTMITLTEAKKVSSPIAVGEELRIPLKTPEHFGRMAAQNAKQVIIQRLREAERATILQAFSDKKGKVVTGTVQRVEGRTVFIDLGQSIGVLPASEQSRSDSYPSGGRMKVYVKEVRESARGPEIILSRAVPELIQEFFVSEVPEIANGSVVIQSIAREAGSRTKLAVWTSDEKIDPIGSCVGQRGARVQTVISELGGEKIDIIEYSDDQKQFIAHSLSPAKVSRVDLDPETKTARVAVANDQLSLAVGKGGQNVRLAGKLTNWKIDIVEAESGEEKATSEKNNEEPPAAETEQSNHLSPEEKISNS